MFRKANFALVLRPKYYTLKGVSDYNFPEIVSGSVMLLLLYPTTRLSGGVIV